MEHNGAEEARYEPWEENEVSVGSVGGTELTKRSIAEKIDPSLAEHFQVIAARPRDLREDKIRVLWLHDLPHDDEVAVLKTPEGRAKFHKLVFSSHWQHQQYCTHFGIPWSIDHVVIDTPCVPIPEHTKTTSEIRVVYFSTPNRGLEILLPVFEKISEQYDDVYLDVFSSFKLYGWDEMDAKYEPLYEKCRSNPKVTYHGFVTNEALREHLQKCHLFAYPSVWEETSCRCLIESMSAGLVCVHPTLGALPETGAGLTLSYPMDADPNRHANMHYAALCSAIESVRDHKLDSYLKLIKQYADVRFNLTRITATWEALMRGTLEQYPTVESRRFQELTQVFQYKT